MEQSYAPSPEIGEGEYQFKYIDPAGHADLLHAIVLDPAQIDDAWLQELDQDMEAGSGDINPIYRTHRQNDAVRAARHRFEQKLGLDNPKHPLHAPYAVVTSHRPSGLRPSQMYGVLLELSAIADKTSAAISMVQRKPYMLSSQGKSLRLRHAYMKRLGQKLGWNGNVQELAQENPEVLLASEKKVAAIGWIAARHARPGQRDIGSADIARLLRNANVESHLITLASQDKKQYVFGKTHIPQRRGDSTAIKVRVLQEGLYTRLKSASVVKRIGSDVLKAYFKYRPLSADDQRSYPYLQAFIPQWRRAAIEEKNNAKIFITGEEAWLSEMAIPPPEHPILRKGWLTNINRRIAKGSRSIASLRVGHPVFEEIVQERLAFFKLLGWTHEDSPLLPCLDRFTDNRGECLVSPQKVVDILNLLSAYGVDPIEPILEARFSLLAHSPLSLKQRFDVIIEEGCTVNDILGRNTALATYSPPKIRQIIRERKARNPNYPLKRSA